MLKVLLLILALTQLTLADECFVSGTVVDKNKKPLVGATVIAYAPPSGWEDLIVSYRSVENGFFSTEFSCRSTNTTLFLTPPLDFEKNFIPMHPPFSTVDQKYKGLAGIKLPYIKKGTLDIGTVVACDYLKTEIEFVDGSGNPFLPAVIDANLWFRIRPVEGSWIKLGGTSIRDRENAKVNNSSVLKMTLPEGKWIIELNLNYGDGVWYYPDKIVDMNDTSTGILQRLTLKMTRKKTLK